VKVYDELIADHEVAGKLELRDFNLLQVVSKIPYFIRRYFVVELETPEESAFLEFYTRNGFGEMSDDTVIRIPLSSTDSINRVLFCNFITDGSSAGSEVFEFLIDRSGRGWVEIDRNHEIQYDTTIYGTNPVNSSIKLDTFDFLNKCEFFEIDEDSEKTLAEIKAQEELRKKEATQEYVNSVKSAYEKVDVGFLDE
jgi:hypothetical protein